MIKEEKNIDFYTTGRQPSEQEFAKISECITEDKAKKSLNSMKNLEKKSASHNKTITVNKAESIQQ